MTYAMILSNRVIDKLTQESKPSYPPDPLGNEVIAIQCDDAVMVGMTYDPNTGEFSDPPLCKPERVEPTDTERIMQAMTDSELRDLEIQQGQEMLAQQMTDIELAVLGGGTTV